MTGGITGNSGTPSSHLPWFFDLGASAHVTHDATQISGPSYPTPSTVTVGNGVTVFLSPT